MGCRSVRAPESNIGQVARNNGRPRRRVKPATFYGAGHRTGGSKVGNQPADEGIWTSPNANGNGREGPKYTGRKARHYALGPDRFRRYSQTSEFAGYNFIWQGTPSVISWKYNGSETSSICPADDAAHLRIYS